MFVSVDSAVMFHWWDRAVNSNVHLNADILRIVSFCKLSVVDTPYKVSALIISPVSILHKSIVGRYRPVRVADGPITARCRFKKNASWVCCSISIVVTSYIDCSLFALSKTASIPQVVFLLTVIRSFLFFFVFFFGCRFSMFVQTTCVVVNPISIDNLLPH